MNIHQDMGADYLATLFLPEDAFDLKTNQLIGRRVAGSNLVKGITENLRDNERLNIYTNSEQSKKKLEDLLGKVKPISSKINITMNLSKKDLETLFIQDPDIVKYNVLRAGDPSDSFSIVGIIHTLSSINAIKTIQSTVTGHLEDWDALICTSSSGKKVVENIINYHHQTLEKKFDMALPRKRILNLPVIPLAVKDFLTDKDSTREDKRMNARNILGLPRNSIIILYLGRLCAHAKAHPLSIYQAVSKTATNCKDKNILLLECGVFNNKYSEAAYNDLARNTKDLSLMRLGGLNNATEKEKELALMASDVFISPSDNIQETFGITVIEAMSAELPVIISDWNGYKDFVKDGHNGYLIPTSYYLGSEKSLDFIDKDYQLEQLDYDHMVGIRSMNTIVDSDIMAERLIFLANNPHKRKELGINAKKNWESKYSWVVVQQQLRDLWKDLSMKRRHSNGNSIQRPVIPPIKFLFDNYGSQVFDKNSILLKKSSISPEILKQTLNIPFSKIIIGSFLDKLITFIINNESLDSQDLSNIGIPPEKHKLVISIIVKLGLGK